MASYAKVTLIGYLGRDPELRYTPNGNAVCNFSVAATEKIGSEEVTTWFRVSAWGKQGELCNEYLHKGSQVYVEGRIRLETYTDREGNNRSNLEVNAKEIQFLGRRGESADNDAPRRAADSEARRDDREARREVLKGSDDIVDPDIPF